MKNKEKAKELKSLKECFKQLAFTTPLKQEEIKELKDNGIEETTYNMYIAFKTMQKAINGDAKALKVYLEQTGQDTETEFKERELKIKEKLFCKEWANIINAEDRHFNDVKKWGGSGIFEIYEHITDAQTEYEYLLEENKKELTKELTEI